MTAALALRLMTPDEARACVSAINNHFDGARALLLALYEREGWRALGFESWRACVVACFKRSQSYLYYQLDAARTERDLSTMVETDGLTLPTLRERHLRAIAELPRDEQRAAALELASSAQLTIKDHRRIIAQKQRDAPVREHPQVVPSAIALGDRCRIEIGDARHLPLDDGVAHLVVTSPPYNARVPYVGYLDWLPWSEYWGLVSDALREAYRVLCSGGRLCLSLANVVRQDVPDGPAPAWVHGGHWRWRPPGAVGRPWAALVEQYLYPLATEIGFLPRERIQWIKGADSENVTTPSTAWGTWCSAANPVMRAVGEPVYVFSKERYDRESGSSDLDAEEFKAWTRNVWFIPVVGLDAEAFPAAFPEELPHRLIKLYSYTDDLVVDPFLGSGTTAVASAKLGRRTYGCDISAHSVALARARVAREAV